MVLQTIYMVLKNANMLILLIKVYILHGFTWFWVQLLLYICDTRVHACVYIYLFKYYFFIVNNRKRGINTLKVLKSLEKRVSKHVVNHVIIRENHVSFDEKEGFSTRLIRFIPSNLRENKDKNRI